MRTETTASSEVALGRGGRMSRRRKRDAVPRLLRGEDLETLSRALGVTAATLSERGEAGLTGGPPSRHLRSALRESPKERSNAARREGRVPLDAQPSKAARVPAVPGLDLRTATRRLGKCAPNPTLRTHPK